MDSLTVLILLSCACAWACVHALTYAVRGGRKSLPDTKKLPPGPLSLPIVGNLFKLGNKPHKSLAELANTYGPLMTLKLGSVITVVVSSPSMAKEVLHNKDQLFAGRNIPDAIRSHHHNEYSIVWLPISPTWRNIRKIGNSQIFAMHRLAANQDLRHQKVKELLAYIHDRSESGQAVDIGKVAFVTTLNLLSNTMFSIDMAHLNTETAQEFKNLMWGVMEETGRPNLADYFPVLRSIDPQGVRRRMEIYFGKLDEIFDKIMNQRLCRSDDVIDILIDLSHDDNPDFSRQHVKALLKDLFAAGTDTSSSTLEWAMTELIRHPNIMEKAKLELQETIGKNKLVEESDIVRLPYLQAIIKETLRLHPPIPFLVPHRAERDAEICGFVVPKHAQVLVNVWPIGRDPNIWVKPTSFMPDRFLGSSIDFRGQDFELIPFGSGRRICPGLPLAYRMVHLMLASLIHWFGWKLEYGMEPEDISVQEKFGLTLQKAEPLRAIPIKD